MKKYLFNLAVMAMGTSLLTSCLGDDSNNNNPPEVVVTKGVFVINNGNTNQSIDGSLTYIDYATTTPVAHQDVYKNANGKSLGGTPNDVMTYGQKVYIVGSDENTIFILDVKTAKELKQVSTTDLLGVDEGKTPRSITAYGDKVYFTTYGGYVAAIDTINFALQAKYKVGSYPEGLSFGLSSGSTTQVKLYVANSDWSMGNGSISCIDIASGSITEIKNDKVKNPQQIAVAGDLLYVLDYGHYDGDHQQDAGVYLINGSITSLVIPNATGMATAGRYIYTFNDPWGGTTGPAFFVYDIRANNPMALNLTGDSAHPIISPAAIAVDSNTGNIFIASRQKDPDTGFPSYAMPGFINVYSSNGQFIESFDTGVEPHKIEFSYGIAKIIYK